jgi:hypothetical protein
MYQYQNVTNEKRSPSTGVFRPVTASAPELMHFHFYRFLQRRLKRWSSCDNEHWTCINSSYYQDCSWDYTAALLTFAHVHDTMRPEPDIRFAFLFLMN